MMPPVHERNVPSAGSADSDPFLLAASACSKASLQVALVIPLQGPAGMFGPTCALSAQLAAEQINFRGGLMGREIRLVTVDGGAPLAQVAQEVDQLVTRGLVEAVTGWHISAVRQVLISTLRGRVPYVYTPLYEGGERHPGVFLTGETPERHMEPSMRWLSNEFGIRRWSIIGNDYVWPRSSAESAYRFTRQHRSNICSEMYVPLGSTDFRGVLEQVERSGAQGVLQLLVGEDAVHFNRAFADAGLDAHAVRFSPLMDENMLLAGGVESSRALYSSAGFFEGLATQGSLDLVGLYAERFGMCAPVLGSLGESCYEGVQLLAALVEQAGSLAVPEMMRVADTVGYDGPRGAVYMRDRHLVQDIHLACADGLQFDVIASF